MNPEVVYGLRDGEITHIAEVVSGLNCHCVCASCGRRLVAKKGEIKTHHFAHEENSECRAALESSLHIAAKEILKHEMRVMLPEYRIRDFGGINLPDALFHEMLPFCKSQILEFDEIKIEPHYGSIIPDVMIFKRGHPLIIEIKVSHAVDDLKLRKIRALGISAIEIDLLNTNSPSTTYNGFVKDYVIDSKLNKEWLYNKRGREYRSLLKNIRKISRLDAWYMHDEGWYAWKCPLLVRECCNECQYLMGYNQTNQTGRHYKRNPDRIYCELLLRREALNVRI